MSDESGAAAHEDSKQIQVELDVSPEAIADLVGKKLPADASEEEKGKAATSTASHDISLKVSNMTFADFQSKLGTTKILNEGDLSLTPASGTDPLHADLHLDLLNQQWASLGDLTATTDISGGLKVTDGQGVGGSFEIKQDVTYKSITLEGSITTDFSGGKPQVTGQVGLKFEF